MCWSCSQSKLGLRSHSPLPRSKTASTWIFVSPEAPFSVPTLRIEGVVAMALNQLDANSRKPRDLESLGPSIVASTLTLGQLQPDGPGLSSFLESAPNLLFRRRQTFPYFPSACVSTETPPQKMSSWQVSAETPAKNDISMGVW